MPFLLLQALVHFLGILDDLLLLLALLLVFVEVAGVDQLDDLLVYSLLLESLGQHLLGLGRGVAEHDELFEGRGVVLEAIEGNGD